jgi:hypothetical protein
MATFYNRSKDKAGPLLAACRCSRGDIMIDAPGNSVSRSSSSPSILFYARCHRVRPGGQRDAGGRRHSEWAAQEVRGLVMSLRR